MCGIFGYIGKGRSVRELIEGLAKLEYRGYDSCGIIGFTPQGRRIFKKQRGKIRGLKDILRDELNTQIVRGLLHTRWATHGQPTRVNAHPQRSCGKNFFVVHNGIIENYMALKDVLVTKKHRFISDTDTEVIAHLLEDLTEHDGWDQAIFQLTDKLKGSFALGIIAQEDVTKIVGIRKGSPLAVGINREEVFLASDIPALLPFTSNIVYLRDEEIVVAKLQGIEIFNFKKRKISFSVEKVKFKPEAVEKEGFEHFMLKEIFEQPDVLERTISLYVRKGRIHFPELHLSDNFLRKVRKIYITACGSAYHAGYIGKYFLERFVQQDIEVDTSSELRYRDIDFRKDDLMIAISQSGETADTLAAVRKAHQQGVNVISICNVLGSSILKESTGYIYTPAGPEIGVASTKAYTNQIMVLFLFGLYLSSLKKRISCAKYRSVLNELKRIPQLQKEILASVNKIKIIAKRFSRLGCFLFLGRGINYPSALEGALKLKEISYIPAEGYPAGEMKHGPIALIDEYRAVVCIAPHDDLYEKMVANIQEIKARKGKVLSVVNHDDRNVRKLSDSVIFVSPTKEVYVTPLLVALPLQLFAYFVAKNLGCEIDQPRNLAKSVTVE